jgi:IS4 transposase
LLGSNTDLAFENAFEIYATRWTVEVFFKECKQLLRLGKSESRHFEAQIAATTL